MNKTMLRKYAKLIVKVGANVQKGQGVVINVAVDQHEFATYLIDEAYKAGAKWVSMEWLHQPATKLAYRHETVTTLSKVPKWKEEKMQYWVDENPCRIFILSEDPDGLKGVNVAKMQKARIAQMKVLKPYRDAMENKYQWTIAAVPSPKWAKKVFPGERTSVAMKKLWDAILTTVHVTADNDPVAAWDAHNQNFKEKCEKLNSYQLASLHYESANGTNFTVGLIDDAQWMGGGETALNGNFFNPNLPTEEIFTSPMKGRAEGTVVSTKPLSYQGQLIENFSMTFENGKVVSCTAEKGQEALEKMIGMDEGAAYLGEVALIPYHSPISNTGILFYETLFDENASCHLAVGSGFTNVLKGFETMSKEETMEKGINDSNIHVDFMIGAPDLCITGYTKDGTVVEIFKDGNWADNM